MGESRKSIWNFPASFWQWMSKWSTLCVILNGWTKCCIPHCVVTAIVCFALLLPIPKFMRHVPWWPHAIGLIKVHWCSISFLIVSNSVTIWTDWLSNWWTWIVYSIWNAAKNLICFTSSFHPSWVLTHCTTHGLPNYHVHCALSTPCGSHSASFVTSIHQQHSSCPLVGMTLSKYTLDPSGCDMVWQIVNKKFAYFYP